MQRRTTVGGSLTYGVSQTADRGGGTRGLEADDVTTTARVFRDNPAAAREAKRLCRAYAVLGMTVPLEQLQGEALELSLADLLQHVRSPAFVREADVWIVRFDAARPLAEALRAMLLELHKQLTRMQETLVGVVGDLQAIGQESFPELDAVAALPLPPEEEVRESRSAG